MLVPWRVATKNEAPTNFLWLFIREIWLNASVRRRPLPMKVDESTGWLGALWNYVG